MPAPAGARAEAGSRCPASQSAIDVHSGRVTTHIVTRPAEP
ncbi:hypothetical protein [Streptomyces albofaciens]|nr:hypothetical protein [Streptomyces albofaciens]